MCLHTTCSEVVSIFAHFFSKTTAWIQNNIRISETKLKLLGNIWLYLHQLNTLYW
jgi:hypothetical protein